MLAIIRQLPGNYLILLPDYPDFTVAEVSEEYNITTKTSRKDLIGKKLFELFPDNPNNPEANGREKLTESFMKVIATKQSQQMAIQRYDVQFTGTEFFAEKYWLPVNKPVIMEDKVCYIIHQVDDVTENRALKISERATQESENRLFKMLNSIPQIIWTNTPQGKVSFYNEQSSIYSGFDYNNIADWTLTVHPEEAERTRMDFYNILKSGKGGEFESLYKNVEGNYRWFLNRLQPIKDANNNIEQWIGTATDIHDLKMLQQQKEDFISIVSHEIKTPITSLKVSMQLLNRMKDAPSATVVPSLIAKANKGVEKVSALIEDLLDVGKLNGKQAELEIESFCIADLIRDCLQHLEIEGIHQIEIIGQLDLEVLGDKDRIEQVIVNFVNNAIKYAPRSKIFIELSEKDEKARIAVRDEGKGIPTEKLPFIFDRYYRVESKGDQISGLGLGLFICADIIKRHQGQIGVESEIGNGSTFWFTLPLGAQSSGEKR